MQKNTQPTDIRIMAELELIKQKFGWCFLLHQGVMAFQKGGGYGTKGFTSIGVMEYCRDGMITPCFLSITLILHYSVWKAERYSYYMACSFNRLQRS
jgi:hypothetical protein